MKPEFSGLPFRFVFWGSRALGGALFFLSFQIPVLAADDFLNRVLFVAGRFSNFPGYVGQFASIKGERVLPFIKRFPYFFCLGLASWAAPDVAALGISGLPLIGAVGNGERQLRPDRYLPSGVP